MFGRSKAPSMTLAEYALKLKDFSNDPEQIKHFFGQSPSLSPNDKLTRHAAALQWYAVHLYNISMNYRNMPLVSIVRAATDSEATLGTKLMRQEYMDNLDPLLEKPGRTAMSESFVEDIGEKFSEVCGKDVSESRYDLASFGRLVYRSTFQRCLDRFNGYIIR
ncbi:MAG: hypothetical protein AAGU74_06250 [Bacillota bacterium]